MNERSETRGRKARYPWGEWTNGDEHVIVASELGTTAEKLRQALWVHAKRKGLSVRTRVDGESIIFTFTKGSSK